MSVRPFLALLTALALLTGCGTNRGDGFAGALLSGAQGLIARPGAAPDIRAGLTRAAIDQAGQPLLLAEIPARGAVAGLLLAARNGPHTTWTTADRITLSFRRGVLNATRGLGGDLMAADLADPVAMILGGGEGRGVRIHSYLDGENQSYTRSFVCTVRQEGRQTIAVFDAARRVRVVRESCAATDLAFENIYWVGGDGIVWQSRQWASPQIGYILTERLHL